MLPGPDKRDCPCGCGAFGTPRKKAWGDGLRHVKGCGLPPHRFCRRCDGSRHRGRSRRRENRVALDLEGERQPLSGALSGADVIGHLWAFEETSNVAVIRGFRRWWTSKTVRTKVARLFARHGEARALVLSWDGRPQVVITSYDDFVGQFPNQSRENASSMRVLWESTRHQPGEGVPGGRDVPTQAEQDGPAGGQHQGHPLDVQGTGR